MNQRSRLALLAASVILFTALVPIFGCPTPGNGGSNLEERVAKLEMQIAELNQKLEHVSVQDGEINSLAGPHFIIEGANVHIRNGGGDTFTPDGRGNLIVGYNESPINFDHGRTGSHNVVIGVGHEFVDTAGLVAGESNDVTGQSAVAIGGAFNTSAGRRAAIYGGTFNDAVSGNASVLGGNNNEASGVGATVSGGDGNIASGSDASVTGGHGNIAAASRSSVNGGMDNIASERDATVNGGSNNTASGFQSTVGGGKDRTASGVDDWAAGSLEEDN